MPTSQGVGSRERPTDRPGPSHPAGRSLEPGSNARPREMVVLRPTGEQNSAYTLPHRTPEATRHTGSPPIIFRLRYFTLERMPCPHPRPSHAAASPKLRQASIPPQPSSIHINFPTQPRRRGNELIARAPRVRRGRLQQLQDGRPVRFLLVKDFSGDGELHLRRQLRLLEVHHARYEVHAPCIDQSDTHPLTPAKKQGPNQKIPKLFL